MAFSLGLVKNRDTAIVIVFDFFDFCAIYQSLRGKKECIFNRCTDSDDFLLA
jgi:hypothetical protein